MRPQGPLTGLPGKHYARPKVPSGACWREFMESVVTHPALPVQLHWHSVPEAWSTTESGALTIVAGARTDLFIDPQTAAEALNAPCLLGHLTGDFTLSARVMVDFAATFDAGALVLYTHD